jgi:hypothetical protein
MRSRLLIGGIIAWVVIFNLGYVFHDLLLHDWFQKHIGEITRDSYIIPVIALSFAIYITLMSLVYPVFYSYFSEKKGLSKIKTGLIIGLFFGFLWDSLQGGLIEYATYKVSLSSMLLDSFYHTLEGGVAGLIIGAFYKPQSDDKA